MFIFCISASIVRAVCHTLHLTLSTGYITVRSIKSNNCILTVACAVIFIHNSTSREDMPQSITDNRRVEVFPMNQVFAHGMSPMHIPPHRAVWIMLEIKVIFTIFINQSVGIVHPSIKRSVMVKRTEFISVCCIKCIRDFNAVPTKSISGHIADSHRSAPLILSQSERYIIFYTVDS